MREQQNKLGEHPAARLGVGRWGRQDLGSRLLPRRVRRRQRHFRRAERDNQVSSHITMSLLVSRHLSKHGFSCRRVSLNHRGHYSPASLRGHNVHSLITADHTLRDLSNQASASSEGYFACVSSFSCTLPGVSATCGKSFVTCFVIFAWVAWQLQNSPTA